MNKLVRILIVYSIFLSPHLAGAEVSVLLHAITNALHSRPDAPDAHSGVYKVLLSHPGEEASLGSQLSDCSGFAVESCLITVAHCLDRPYGEAALFNSNGVAAKLVKDQIVFRGKSAGELDGIKIYPQDLAVAKLDRKPVGAYSADILADKLPEVRIPASFKIQNPEDLIRQAEELKAFGEASTSVGYGIYASTDDLKEYAASSLKEKSAILNKLSHFQRNTALRQQGEVVVVGKIPHIAQGLELSKVALVKKIEDILQKDAEAPADQKIGEEEVAKLHSYLKRARAAEQWMAGAEDQILVLPNPAVPMHGDSGGVLEDKEKKFWGLITDMYGLPVSYAGALPLVEHKSWILEQLKQLGCTGKSRSALEAMPQLQKSASNPTSRDANTVVQ